MGLWYCVYGIEDGPIVGSYGLLTIGACGGITTEFTSSNSSTGYCV